MDQIVLKDYRKYLRQQDIFDPRIAEELPVFIIGAGGIGGPTALLLAKLGMQKITVVDFDKVEEHNQPNQIFGQRDLGTQKTLALREIVERLTDTSVETRPLRITEETPRDFFRGIVISAVDKMSSRSIIWQKVRFNPAVRLFIDGRIGGQVLRLYTVNPVIPDHIQFYEKTIHPDEEGVELPCTARAVIDVGFFIASFITRAVRLHLKDDHMEKEVLFDVRNLSLDVEE